jgi:hypothetical protein
MMMKEYLVGEDIYTEDDVVFVGSEVSEDWSQAEVDAFVAARAIIKLGRNQYEDEQRSQINLNGVVYEMLCEVLPKAMHDTRVGEWAWNLAYNALEGSTQLIDFNGHLLFVDLDGDSISDEISEYANKNWGLFPVHGHEDERL